MEAAETGGFHIALVPDAGLAANPAALDAFRRAAAQWEAVISSPVTVTIGAGLANLGDPDLIGQTRPTTLSGSYTRVRDAIVAVHQDQPVIAAMPTAAQFTASIRAGFTLDGTLSATKANLKALGFADLDATFGPSDATITFNSTFSFDFDNRDGVTADTIDFETVAAHEIGHVLGFSSSVDVIDTVSPRPVRAGSARPAAIRRRRGGGPLYTGGVHDLRAQPGSGCGGRLRRHVRRIRDVHRQEQR